MTVAMREAKASAGNTHQNKINSRINTQHIVALIKSPLRGQQATPRINPNASFHSKAFICARHFRHLTANLERAPPHCTSRLHHRGAVQRQLGLAKRYAGLTLGGASMSSPNQL